MAAATDTIKEIQNILQEIVKENDYQADMGRFTIIPVAGHIFMSYRLDDKIVFTRRTCILDSDVNIKTDMEQRLKSLHEKGYL